MSPRTIDVHPLRLFAQASHARMMRDHGMGLARNAGTVRSIAAEYGLSVRTWAQLADALAPIVDDVRAQLADAHERAEPVSPGTRFGSEVTP